MFSTDKLGTSQNKLAQAIAARDAAAAAWRGASLSDYARLQSAYYQAESEVERAQRTLEEARRTSAFGNFAFSQLGLPAGSAGIDALFSGGPNFASSAIGGQQLVNLGAASAIGFSALDNLNASFASATTNNYSATLINPGGYTPYANPGSPYFGYNPPPATDRGTVSNSTPSNTSSGYTPYSANSTYTSAPSYSGTATAESATNGPYVSNEKTGGYVPYSNTPPAAQGYTPYGEIPNSGTNDNSLRIPIPKAPEPNPQPQPHKKKRSEYLERILRQNEEERKRGPYVPHLEVRTETTYYRNTDKS